MARTSESTSPHRPGFTVTYVWRETIRRFSVNGDTYAACPHFFDWYCVEVGINANYAAGPGAPPQINRRGSVIQSGTSARLTEDADSSFDYQATYFLARKQSDFASPEYYYMRPFNLAEEGGPFLDLERVHVALAERT